MGLWAEVTPWPGATPVADAREVGVRKRWPPETFTRAVATNARIDAEGLLRHRHHPRHQQGRLINAGIAIAVAARAKCTSWARLAFLAKVHGEVCATRTNAMEDPGAGIEVGRVTRGAGLATRAPELRGVPASGAPKTRSFALDGLEPARLTRRASNCTSHVGKAADTAKTTTWHARVRTVGSHATRLLGAGAMICHHEAWPRSRAHGSLGTRPHPCSIATGKAICACVIHPVSNCAWAACGLRTEATSVGALAKKSRIKPI
mmetsp:Transcript_68232/g.172629  ORF Transcript_68232/g.172629 Transcript_68232/m.172629 type:complete len:262 (-) Transcript_68232:768-1553(-)